MKNAAFRTPSWFDLSFLEEAVRMARESADAGRGGPFGCVVVQDHRIIGRGSNNVIQQNDPTAHAEIQAIRDACLVLGSFQLTGCVVYSSCEPCPMCLGAIYWARPDALVFASTRKEAAAAGFDDELIYQELMLPPDKREIETLCHPLPQAGQLLAGWLSNPKRKAY